MDTNGAGDAFAGGFIGAYVLGKNIDDCVLAGHALASMCVQQVSLTYLLLGDKTQHLGRLVLNTSGPRFRSYNFGCSLLYYISISPEIVTTLLRHMRYKCLAEIPK